MVKKLSSREIAEHLHSGAIRVLRRLRKTDDEAGLTGPQASALSVLVFGGAMPLGKLAAAEQVKAPTMSRLIKEMESLELVTRKRDRGDARSVTVDATKKGRHLLIQARDRRLGRLEAAIAKSPPERQRVLAEAATLLLEIADSKELG
jgi:DNA-binding MarR family transcriptional regulator